MVHGATSKVLSVMENSSATLHVAPKASLTASHAIQPVEPHPDSNDAAKNRRPNGHSQPYCMTDAEKIADVKAAPDIDSAPAENMDAIDHATNSESGMISIPRFEWQKMMNILNELRQAQKSLVFESARSNERIKELERDAERSSNGSKANTPVAKSTTTKVISNGGRNKALASDIVRIPDYSGNISEKASPATSGQQTQRSKKSWAEIAKTNRPRLVDVSKTVQDRIRQSRDMLKDVIYRPNPRPTALYFRNIRRVQLGVVRKALRNMQLPPWALLVR